MIRTLLVRASCFLAVAHHKVVVGIEPETVDYSKNAFYPDRWKKAEVSFKMLAWKGKHVTLLTKPGQYDKADMYAFVEKLDGGWGTYSNLVGKSPELLRQIDGKPTICALPKPNLSCGYGCGHVGATGIEVAGFYRKDFPALAANPKSFEHYCFYEMGRNYFVFGDRHSLYTTGYAVFMRYVCMDQLECVDNDLETRRTIESCEKIYADSKIRFLDAFTNLSAGEKGNRLKDLRSGRTIVPSDQPVMYATAMLKLRKDYGGDAWVKKFLHHLHKCPKVKATDEVSAMEQSFNWLVCASAAAGKDLSPVFGDRWRMPLTPKQRDILEKANFQDDEFDPKPIIDRLVALRRSKE